MQVVTTGVSDVNEVWSFGARILEKMTICVGVEQDPAILSPVCILDELS